MSCCQNNLYNNNFDKERAMKELEDYRIDGPKKNSLPLINFLNQLDLKDASVLDIGSGVGAVIFELFDQGICHATYNDFSKPYSDAFQEEAKKREIVGQVDFYLGDFLETYQEIQNADLVSLDKAICCYKDYRGLISHSIKKAKKWYAFTLPRDIWWVRIAYFLKQKIRWLKRNPFRSYVHPINKIEAIISEHGFKKIHNEFNGEWQTVVFEKVS